MTTTITPRALFDLTQSGTPIELIDVRTPAEFREIHVACARNVPLDQLNPSEFDTAEEPDRPLYVICRSGSRGRQACEKLAAAGNRAVVNIEGGTHAWDQAGLPVVRGQKTMSLERQVRIAAGLMVLSGAVLGLVVSPAWIGLSAFVGAGLVFAGVTDSCGMGMLLARMPWNQVASTTASRPAPPASRLTTTHKSCCR